MHISEIIVELMKVELRKSRIAEKSNSIGCARVKLYFVLFIRKNVSY